MYKTSIDFRLSYMQIVGKGTTQCSEFDCQVPIELNKTNKMLSNADIEGLRTYDLDRIVAVIDVIYCNRFTCIKPLKIVCKCYNCDSFRWTLKPNTNPP